MQTIDGEIVGYDESGVLHIEARYDDIQHYAAQKPRKCRILLIDSRTISREQQKKAHALLGEIRQWIGDLEEYVKKLMKIEFIQDRMQGLSDRIFSLANCDMTLAREFISYLVEFIIEHGVPCKVPLVDLCEDVKQYEYACIMKGVCVVCGRKAELHHVDPVGMGRNRDEIIHIGMRCLTLCREHHDEYHVIQYTEFMKKYHLDGAIPVDEKIAKRHKLRSKKKV